MLNKLISFILKPLNHRHTLLMGVLIITLTTVTGLAQQALAQPEPTQEPACQIYRPAVTEVRVRACPSTGCSIIGGLTLQDSVCVRGVSDNPDWLVVDLQPDNPDNNPGYVSRELIEPGAPGQVTDLSPFCNAYEVLADELVVRTGPDQTNSAIGSYAAGDVICVLNYDGEFNYWYQFTNPATGETGWVENTAIDYQYNESLGCAEENSWIAVETANIRECSQITCDVTGTLEVGTPICVIGEQLTDAEWVQVEYEDGQLGWVSALLIQQVPESELQATALAPTPLVSLVSQPVTEATEEPVDPQATDAPDNTTTPSAPVVCPAGSAPQNGECIVTTPISLGSFQNLPAQPTPPATGPILSRAMTLASLFFDNVSIFSPVGSARFFFTVPQNWQPTGTNTLFLDLAYFENLTRVSDATEGVRLSSVVDIFIDDRLIASVVLTSENVGNQVLEIPLPNDILADPETRTHGITLALEAQDACNAGVDTRVVIDGSKSFLQFQYQEFPPVLDLALYPRPFFNRIIGENISSALIVLADEPTEQDVQAAANIAAGLGQLTRDDLRLQVVPFSALTAETRASNQIIAIGTADGNPYIQAMYDNNQLPSQRAADGTLSLEGRAIESDDGVVQIASNPDNNSLAALIITGQTPDAVVKASSAMAGQPSVYGLGGPILVVEDVNLAGEPIDNTFFDEAFTLRDLGFDEDIIIDGSGIQSFTIDFDLPRNAVLTENAYFDMIYNYSASLNSQQATVTLLMNETPIASAYLNDRGPVSASAEVGTQFDARRIRAFISPSTVNPGETNRLQIIVDMRGEQECEVPNANAIWFTVGNNSEFSLPRIEGAALPTTSPTVNLFPVPFSESADLQDLFISLPATPTFSDITQLIQIVSAIGSGTNTNARLTPHITFGEFDESVELSAGNIIAIGLNTTNPFITALNDNLPQPFAEGTNDLQQVLENVVYRLQPGFTLGVLQTLESVYNPENAMMIISGTNETGQAIATNALLNRDGLYNLFGNIVFATLERSTAVDTRTIYDNSEIIEEINNAVTAPSETPAPTDTPAVASVTPQATPTLVLTPTPATVGQAIVAQTAQPAATNTPIPTLAPLDQSAFTAAPVERPPWIDTLIIVTVVAVNIAVFYGLFVFLRSRRREES